MATWLSRWICWLVGVVRWVRSGMGFWVSGCDLVTTEVHENVTVIVDRCEICGRFSLGWRQGPPESWEHTEPAQEKP